MNRAIICHKYKFIYVPIPKNACSAMRIWILELLGDDNIKKLKGDELHIYVHTTQKIQYISMNSISNWPAYYKFTIIRNPGDRVLSVYNDKFIINKLRGHPNLPWKKLYKSKPNGITFVDFLKFINPGKQNIWDGEPHWRSQHLLASINNINYDKIIKIEELSKEIDILYNTLNIPIKLRTLHISNKTNNNNDEQLNVNKLINTPNMNLKTSLPKIVLDNHIVTDLIKEKYSLDFKMLVY